MSKKVLVTGASGFIGNYIINKLFNSNYSIIATSTDLKRIRSKSWLDKVEFIPYNFENYNSAINYYDFFGAPDLMIHLAWEGLPNYKSLFHFEINLPRHYSFLKNMIINGLKDLTITGTCLEYGFVEGCLSESMKTDPSVSYAIAKDSLQKFLSQLQKVQHFSFKWIRLFYMYGIGQNPNSLFSQLDKAIEQGQKIFNMSGGEQLRDYLPVGKAAEHIVKIAMQNEVTGIINCCSGEPVSIKELVRKYLTEKGQHLELNLGYHPYTDYEPMAFWGDNEKLKTIIEHE